MPSVPINTAALGQSLLVAAPASNRFIRVLVRALVCAGAVSVKMQDGNTDLEGAMPFTTNTGISEVDENGLFDCTPGNALNINLSAAVQVSGHLKYEIKGY